MIPVAAARTAAFYRVLRTTNALRLTANRLERVVSGFAQAALHREELALVNARLYDADKVQQRGAEGAFDWERAWWSRALPAAPARILVGGCGRGREVCALLALGHEVWAFDPSLESLRDCRRDNPGAAFVGGFDYEALAVSPAAWLPDGVRFDAVVMGWTSLSHVIEEHDQERVLAALGALAPTGPVLASFLMVPGTPERGRSEALGFALGRPLGRLRAVARTQHDPCVRALGHTGFFYSFTEERLHALAAACGRRLELDLATRTPSAAFWPGGLSSLASGSSSA